MNDDGLFVALNNAVCSGEDYRIKANGMSAYDVDSTKIQSIKRSEIDSHNNFG